MVPLQHPWGRAPSLGPCLWQRSAAGCPKNTYSGSHPATFAQGLSLKNEFSLGTHQAGRVPTWSLYNTHGVAPLRLAPFLGYTGVIPMLIHSHNTPPPNTCTHSLPKKRVFPGYPPTQQGTHMVPLQHPWGRAPSLGPCLWQRSAAGCPKTPILGPTRPLSPKVSLKNEFSLGTHLPSRVPTWSLYNTHGVAPRRLAPVSGNEALPDAQKHLFWVPPGHFPPKVSLKNEFSLGTHLPSRVPTWSLYNTHGVAPRRLAPVSGNEALPDAQKHLFWVPPATFAQGLPKKRVFPGYPPGGSSTHMVSL